jgi:iron complex transport system substrate-binding protein
MMRRGALQIGVWLAALCCAAAAHAAIAVRDDSGQWLTLQRPARRIVVLSPQLLELGAAAGALPDIVASVRGADTPAQAAALPRVGDAFALNLETIASLHPDLVLAWSSGVPPRQRDALRGLGVPVYWSQTDSLEQIATTVRRIGALSGHDAAAARWAQAYDARLAALRAAYAGRPPLRVFFQLWAQPLLTPGGPQLLNQAIAVCGGRNPFATLPRLSAAVSREAVIGADPQLIVASGEDPHALDAWRQTPQVDAVRRHQLVLLDPALLPRMGARVLDGVDQLCKAIDAARPAR